jgi:hypothetical protein
VGILKNIKLNLIKLGGKMKARINILIVVILVIIVALIFGVENYLNMKQDVLNMGISYQSLEKKYTNIFLFKSLKKKFFAQAEKLRLISDFNWQWESFRYHKAKERLETLQKNNYLNLEEVKFFFERLVEIHPEKPWSAITNYKKEAHYEDILEELAIIGLDQVNPKVLSSIKDFIIKEIGHSDDRYPICIVDYLKVMQKYELNLNQQDKKVIAQTLYSSTKIKYRYVKYYVGEESWTEEKWSQVIFLLNDLGLDGEKITKKMGQNISEIFARKNGVRK